MKRAFFTALFFTTLLARVIAQYFPVDTARLNKAYRTLEKQLCWILFRQSSNYKWLE